MDFEEYGLVVYKNYNGHIYVLGCKKFTPLELTLKNDDKVEFLEKVYFGNEKREKIQSIVKWIDENEFARISKTVAFDAIRKIILEQQEFFTKFINKLASQDELKKNTLQKAFILGPKTLEKIIEAHNEKPFESFEDLEKRARTGVVLRNLTTKIYNEINGKDRLRIFVNKAKQQ